MSPPPRPRSDEKAAVILEAARHCLARRGYATATVSEIAREAGVSRGLLHYYFASKEDLLARVVGASITRSLEMVASLFASADSADQLAQGLAMALRTLIEHDPDFFTLIFECWVVARQSPMVATEVDRMFADFREAFEHHLGEAEERGVIAPRMPLDGLATLLSAVLDGLALQLVLDSELAARDSLWTTVEHSIRRLLGS